MKLNHKKRKIKLFDEFPKMLWLGDESLYEKAIFIRNYDQFNFMIDELSFQLNKRKYYEQK